MAATNPPDTESADPAETRASGFSFNPRRVFYGWWLVAVSGSVMVVSTTPMFHAMGLWFVALETHFGWTRTQLSLAFAFTRIEGGILGPIEGYLVDRFGTRRLVFIGMTIMGLGWILFSQIQDLTIFGWEFRGLWMFYLVYLIIALGQGLGSWLPLMTMLNNWFNRHRAKAMGFSNSVSRIGTLAIVPALAWAIDPDYDRLGWATTAFILGIVILIVVFPLASLIRNRPEEYGLLPDGDAPEAPEPESGSDQSQKPRPKPSEQADFTLTQALKTPAFWLISIGHGFTSMILIAMMAHLAPMMKDQGYDLQTSAFVITGYTAVSMLFQIIGGFVGDRVPKNFALWVFTWIQASGVFLLTFGPATLPVAYGFALLFGIGFGGRNPLTVSIRGDYFGRRSFGKIMGISQVPMNILLLTAPVFAGLVRDITGEYTFAFAVLAGFNMMGGVLFLFARRPTPR